MDTEALYDLSKKIKLLFPMLNTTSRGSQQIHILSFSKDSKNRGALNTTSDSKFPFSESETGFGNFPKISIVTPNYNQGKFLEKCIQSVCTQDYPNVEYIIIDGASTDNSLEIIKKYEKHITFWVSEKDYGQADAINKGLNRVSGVIFNWLNSDDYLEPQALLKCAEAYKKNSFAVGWVGGCRRVDIMGKILSVIHPHSLDRENIGQNWYGTQFYQPSCFLSTKRVREVGGLDPDLRIAFDLDLWIRILEKGELVPGKGIWSNAIIHTEAKTQKLKRNVSLETSYVQNKYGFQEGANVRHNMAVKKRGFQYVRPPSLNNSSRRLANSSKIPTNVFTEPKSVAFISDALPSHNGRPLDLRLSAIIEVMLANKTAVNFINTSPTKRPETFTNHLKGDINFYHGPPKMDALKTIVSQTEYFWITASNDQDHLKFVANAAKEIKQKGSTAKIIIDCARFFNEKCSENREFDAVLPELIKTKGYFGKTDFFFEIGDRFVASNSKDKRRIEETLGTKGNVAIIPHMYRILESGLPFHRRKNICFFDNFNNYCSKDAIIYFLDNILPDIISENPDSEFHIISKDEAKLRHILKRPTAKVIGPTNNIAKLLVNYKLCVFPVFSEGGVNHAFGITAGAGLPAVTTTIAARGYPVEDGKECFIADSPVEFGEKCNQCLRDLIAWHNFKIKSQLMIANNYSVKIVATNLGKLLSS